ncbi:PTS sugar transporter subunit IIA [bacterium]|nr:PTS sugar transporter subunit IIA [bacterium]
MNIYKYLRKNLCEVNLKSRKKKSAICELAGIIKRHPALEDISEKEIVDALIQREELGSTGFGGGLAIPHCKHKNISEFIVGLAISKRGVNFDAMDGRKVHLFCFIIGPEGDPETHVKILAEVSHILREERVIRELIASKSEIALYEKFLRHAAPEEIQSETKQQKLVMIIIQNEQHFIEIMELFVEIGIDGASITSSEGMAGVLTKVPLFADFINFLGQHAKYHRTIWAVIPTDELEILVQRVEEITGDMNKHIGTILLALDISFFKGTMETV